MTDNAEFKGLVVNWAARLKVKPKQIRIQRMTRKWGSCSTNGFVTFAADLLEESKPFQEYVIVHELLHMRIPNHGRLFQSLIRAHCPRSTEYNAKFGKRRLSEPLTSVVKVTSRR